MISPPPTIGRYEIGRELGHGVMGVVYEAFDPALGRAVALKTINIAIAKSHTDRDSFERRFLEEARIAARLQHPGIVVVHDVGRDEPSGLLFMALERLGGQTLAGLLERGLRPSWMESLQVIRDVAVALQHAHDHGVVHRDIKPANIMMLPSGQAKVLDFGIAKVETASLTAAGQFLGTPLYMSPEQALGLPVDSRTDIFSLGSVGYALLTGRPAFDDESIMKILGRVAYHDVTPPTALDPKLPRDVDYVIARALAKAPADRYAHGRQMAEDIADILKGARPRHREHWKPRPMAPAQTDVSGTLAMRLGPEGASATLTMEPEGARGEGTVPWIPVASGTVPPRRPARLLALAGIVSVALAGVVLRERPAVSAPVPKPAPELPRPVATAAPAPVVVETPPPTEPPPTASPEPAMARVVVDFEHPLSSGRHRVWLDGEELLVEPLRGRVTKNLVLFKLKGGVVTEVLDVEPGRHLVRVEVSWDRHRERRTEEIAAILRPGETYRLEIHLSRLKKDLSLRWTH
jgi:serine/threonine-protein kinase